MLFFASCLVLGADIDNAVGINVEGHFNLRHATRCGGNALQIKAAKALIVLRHFAFTLEHINGDRCLIIFSSGEDLALLGRDGCVAINQTCEHAAQCFNAQRQRSDVEQQHILHIALQNARLNRRANGDNFIRIDALMGLFAEELFDQFLHFGHARHAAHEHDLVNLTRGQARILQSLSARFNGLLDEIIHKRLELSAGQLQCEMLGTRGIGSDIGQIDVCLCSRRQFDLGLFSCFLQTLQSELVLGQINAVFLFEFGREIFNQAHVEIFTAQECIAIGRFDFKNAIANFENGDVESTTAQVINGDCARALFVQAISESCSSRLIDDTQHFKTGNLASILGGLTLCIVEISWHSNDSLCDRLTQIGLGRLLHLLQSEGGNLRGRILFAICGDPSIAIASLDDLIGNKTHILLRHGIIEGATDEALDGEECALWIGDALTFGRLTNKTLAIICEGDDGRRGARAFSIFDHLGARALHDRNARISCSKVNTDYFSHNLSFHNAEPRIPKRSMTRPLPD